MWQGWGRLPGRGGRRQHMVGGGFIRPVCRMWSGWHGGGGRATALGIFQWAHVLDAGVCCGSKDKVSYCQCRPQGMKTTQKAFSMKSHGQMMQLVGGYFCCPGSPGYLRVGWFPCLNLPPVPMDLVPRGRRFFRECRRLALGRCSAHVCLVDWRTGRHC